MRLLLLFSVLLTCGVATAQDIQPKFTVKFDTLYANVKNYQRIGETCEEVIWLDVDGQKHTSPIQTPKKVTLQAVEVRYLDGKGQKIKVMPHDYTGDLPMAFRLPLYCPDRAEVRGTRRIDIVFTYTIYQADGTPERILIDKVSFR